MTVQELIDELLKVEDKSKEIKCEDPIKEHFNITEASKENEILQTSISNCIHGRSKSAGGFIWKLK